MDPDDPVTVAVALKLGWSTQMAAVPGYQTPYRVWRRDDLTRPLPPYSTSIAAVWDLVDKMSDDYEVTIIAAHRKYWCHVRGPAWNQTMTGEAATAPLAICQAFLKLP